jgi:hypothetical protein
MPAEGERPRLAIFGASESRYAAGEVQVRPAQREQLSEAGTRREGEHHERMEERVPAFLAGAKEGRPLFLGEETDRPAGLRGAPHLPHWVVVEPSPIPGQRP